MKETEIIIAEKLFPNFNNIKYVDWAITLMEKGYENENLYILAGLDNDDIEKREKYFSNRIRTEFGRCFLLWQVVQKQLTKLTPSQYRNSLKQDLSEHLHKPS